MIKIFLKLADSTLSSATDQNSAVVIEDVSKSWKIVDLKYHIASLYKNVIPDNLKLIFAGRELGDNLLIEVSLNPVQCASSAV